MELKDIKIVEKDGQQYISIDDASTFVFGYKNRSNLAPVEVRTEYRNSIRYFKDQADFYIERDQLINIMSHFRRTNPKRIVFNNWLKELRDKPKVAEQGDLFYMKSEKTAEAGSNKAGDYAPDSWFGRLSPYINSKRKIVICTFSLPGIKEVIRFFEVRKKFGKDFNVTLLMNDNSAHRESGGDYTNYAVRLKRELPDMQVYTCSNIHAKLVLVEPDIVFVSSENFGVSKGWFEVTQKNVDAAIKSSAVDRLKKFVWFNAVNCRQIDRDGDPIEYITISDFNV